MNISRKAHRRLGSVLTLSIATLLVAGCGDDDSGGSAQPVDLTCTALGPTVGSCYCQTTVTGAVQIFTCFSDGHCVCQGENSADENVQGLCRGESDVQATYNKCFRN